MARGTSTDGSHTAWKRRPITIWFAVIAALIVLLVGFIMIRRNQPPVLSYGVFLDQLGVGNVASVTFEGMQINGRLNHPVVASSTSNKAQADQTTFTSQVPDFGDPALIAELRAKRVAIDVASSSSWASLFARIPWPIWLFGGGLLFAGLRKLMRRGNSNSDPRTPASNMPVHPMQGMMGLVAGLFGKPHIGNPPTPDRDTEK